MAIPLKPFARRIVDRAAFELREWLPPARNVDYQRFVILSPGRAGSSMLVQRCASHPEIRCYGQLLGLNKIGWDVRLRSPASRRAWRVRHRNVVRFLHHHVWHRYPRRIRAVGFKILYNHWNYWHAALEPFFAGSPDLRILWLERRNSFEIYLSRLTGSDSGIWAVSDQAHTPQTAPRAVDPMDCRIELQKMDVMREALARGLDGFPVLRIHYEDLVREPDALNRQICGFLGVTDLPLQHSLRKIAQGSLRERVLNFDELRDHFRGSRWENCFADA